jgi:hypothetical protein
LFPPQPVILSEAKNLWIAEEPAEKTRDVFASLNMTNPKSSASSAPEPYVAQHSTSLPHLFELL